MFVDWIEASNVEWRQCFRCLQQLRTGKFSWTINCPNMERMSKIAKAEKECLPLILRYQTMDIHSMFQPMIVHETGSGSEHPPFSPGMTFPQVSWKNMKWNNVAKLKQVWPQKIIFKPPIMVCWNREEQESPNCAFLANTCLSIPATSALSKRVFSAANRDDSSPRTNLKPKHVEKWSLLVRTGSGNFHEWVWKMTFSCCCKGLTNTNI